jgi:hypothetical protein
LDQIDGVLGSSWLLLLLLASAAGVGLAAMLATWRGQRPIALPDLPPDPPAPLPAGTAGVTTEAALDRSSDRHPDGRIMLVGFGTFGANRVLDILRELALSGLDRAIGSIFLVELDSAQRGRFLAELPSCFRGKLTCLEIPALAGGLANRPPAEVRATITSWGPDLARASEAACRNHSRLQHGQDPALCLVFISPGAHATIGAAAVGDMARHFRRTQFVGLTTLPEDDALRIWMPSLAAAYRQGGLQGGLVLADNRRDQLANDWGMTSLLVGALAAASSEGGAVVHLNNLLSLTLAAAPGRVAAYSTHVRRVPVYSHRTGPDAAAVPYAYVAALRSAIEVGLDEVDRQESHSVDGLGDGPGRRVAGTSRFRVVLVPVDGDALSALEDDIRAGQQMRGAAADPNDHILFAPVAARLNLGAAEPSCLVTVVSLRALPDGEAALAGSSLPRSAVLARGRLDGTADGAVKEQIRADHALGD